MTKDLSKRLCEIVGIKRKRIILEQNCDGTCKYWISPESAICHHTCPEYIKYVYPDFGKPENFVKLLNVVLKIGINEVCDFQLATMSFSQENYFIEGETFEEIWLNCLLCELEPHNPDSWERKYSEMLKQAIREAEWKYE